MLESISEEDLYILTHFNVTANYHHMCLSPEVIISMRLVSISLTCLYITRFQLLCPPPPKKNYYVLYTSTSIVFLLSQKRTYVYADKSKTSKPPYFIGSFHFRNITPTKISTPFTRWFLSITIHKEKHLSLRMKVRLMPTYSLHFPLIRGLWPPDSDSKIYSTTLNVK